MNKYLWILIFFGFSFAPCKKKIIQGFEALMIYDYFKAKDLFERCMKKHEVAASYGLSKIYFEERNHFFNLDSSLFYINRSKKAFQTYDFRAVEKLKQLGISDTSLHVQYRTLSNKAFRYAHDTASVDAYDRVIKKYPQTMAADRAVIKRDSTAFALANRVNTAGAYKEFIDMYPMAPQRFLAMELYELRKFDQISSKKNESDLVQFITENPDSPYLRKVQDELYGLYEELDHIQGYASFIDKYPDNPNIGLAYRNILQLELYDFSEAGINKFLKRYPKSPIHKEAKALKDIIKNGLIQFEHKGTTWVLDHHGNYIFLKPTTLGKVSEGLFSFVQNGKTGFYDHKGRIAIDPIYSDAFSFNRGLAVVENNGLFGVIDRRGRPIIPVQYTEIGEFAEGLIHAFDGHEHSIFNQKAKLVFKTKLEPIGDFKNGCLVVKENDGYGIIDKKGAFIIYPEYDWIENFESDVARFKLNGYYGLVKNDGSVVLENHYDFISRESNGMRILESKNKINYLKNGLVSETNYELHSRKEAAFMDGFAVVIDKGSYGIIDTSLKKVSPMGYQIIFNLGGGLFSVKDRNKLRLFDAHTGKTSKSLYDNIERLGNQKIVVSNEGETAFIDGEENILIPYFTGVLEGIDGYVVKTDSKGKKALFDENGNEIISTGLDEIRLIKENMFLLIQGELLKVYDATKNKIIFEKS